MMDFVFANPQDQGNVKTTGLRNLSGFSSEIWVRLSRKVAVSPKSFARHFRHTVR